MSRGDVPDGDLRACVRRIPTGPGVYRMLDARARSSMSARRRTSSAGSASYFSRALNRRLLVMVAQVADIEVTVTRTEGEALLLESNLIKALKPRFNVLLRDDKSYPYIHLTTAGRLSAPRLLPRPAQGARALLRPLSQRLRRCARPCNCCSSCFRCASARTASTAPARGPASSTRSSAAPGPASGW